MYQNNFSPSINIIRDRKKQLHYIPTANSQRIYNQIIDNYSTGSRSFNIVGSYGTGKSAFLYAFEKHLLGDDRIFKPGNGSFKKRKDFEFLHLVGDYASFTQSFSKKIRLKKNNISLEDIINNFDAFYREKEKGGIGLVILVDEFGKHLEYAAGNNPEKELYFIQLLAEYINDSDKNIIFITILHQNFDSYGTTLDVLQRQEWNKVRGRWKELAFNEPVEQLLSLAADHISKKQYTKSIPKDFKELYRSISESKLFPLKSSASEKFARKLYPFDLLAASVLTISLQKYGQNERSLFTFLQTKDYLGINDYNFKNNLYYNLSAVYDYLLNNFYSFLFTKYNPHYTQWAAIRTAVERVEGMYEKNIIPAAKLVKTIGLLNIFSPEISKINKEFLVHYGKIALQIENPEEIVEELQSKKIIRYAEYKNKFILFEGTDLDIELALKESESKVDKVSDIITQLKNYFDFPYLPAKKTHYEKGTPRFFEFRLSLSPLNKIKHSNVDGVINLVFQEKKDLENLKKSSEAINDAIVYAYYLNTDEIKEILWDINKIIHVINSVPDDLVAKRELNNILSYQIDLLNNKVFQSFYNNKEVIWMFNGEVRNINKISDLNQLMSDVCDKIYYYTPEFQNELINRDKLPSAISLARKNFLEALVNNWSVKDLGFSHDKFPPEKMIYMTLLKNTGIHKRKESEYILSHPKKNNDFHHLWGISSEFLDSTKSRKRVLSDFNEVLSQKPLRLRKGLIDFWVPTFLFIMRDDFALFFEDRYIPIINEEMLELCVKAPNKIHIKAFSVDGVKLDLFHKYRSFINKNDSTIGNKSFIETIKPFLVFYKRLPDYSKNTKRLPKHTLRLRDAIAHSKDPETTFFEDFPSALGFVNLNFNSNEKILKTYIETLQQSINEIKGSFDELVNEVEDSLFIALGYKKTSIPELVRKINMRFDSIKEFMLTKNQKSFYNRIISYNGDRVNWFSSIVISLLDKPLEKISDEEVPLIIDRIKNNISDFDDLCDISKTKNEIYTYKITLTSSGLGSMSKIVRLPDTESKEDKILKENILKNLSKDSKKNIEVLIRLIKQEIEKQ